MNFVVWTTEPPSVSAQSSPPTLDMKPCVCLKESKRSERSHKVCPKLDLSSPCLPRGSRRGREKGFRVCREAGLFYGVCKRETVSDGEYESDFQRPLRILGDVPRPRLDLSTSKPETKIRVREVSSSRVAGTPAKERGQKARTSGSQEKERQAGDLCGPRGSVLRPLALAQNVPPGSFPTCRAGQADSRQISSLMGDAGVAMRASPRKPAVAWSARSPSFRKNYCLRSGHIIMSKDNSHSVAPPRSQARRCLSRTAGSSHVECLRASGRGDRRALAATRCRPRPRACTVRGARSGPVPRRS